ncbi:protein of unknown function [Devosia enhydra]|uniref:DUF4893 domain-containing protein n=1 Tax=Devosia enhydra TaxID=665118 RepID=A0A1K2HYZ3_9HYPH|nr:DUF4893 domain-containing protein [Devosia enhydra]SFZ85226.1 protein of unknown function [Devosia enhydra]
MMNPFFRSVVTASLMLGSVLPAFAACAVPEGIRLSDTDKDRISSLAEARSRGLAQALRATSAADRDLVAGLLSTAPSRPALETLPGDYRCRTIKLGGITDLTVYGWFRCAIRAEGDALSVVKLTGSQNFTGALHAGGEGVLMVGAGHYNQDPPNGYGDDPERDIVGCLAALGEAGTLVLEEPFPRFESVHDLIVFEPIR